MDTGEFVLIFLLLTVFGLIAYYLLDSKAQYITALESVYGMKLD